MFNNLMIGGEEESGDSINMRLGRIRLEEISFSLRGMAEDGPEDPVMFIGWPA